MFQRILIALFHVKGVKWATPNPMKLAEAKAACDPSIVRVGGLAEVWAPAFYAVGARGGAEEMSGTNVTEVKAALWDQSIDCPPTRPPSA